MITWLRPALLFAVSILLIVSVAGSVLAQHPPGEVATEHRFTMLEATVASIASDVHELKERGQWEWLKALGMAGLLGEAGMRSLKRKKPE